MACWRSTAGDGATENRLAKRALTSGTTTGASNTTGNTGTVEVSKDSAQSLALQVVAGSAGGTPGRERALVTSEGETGNGRIRASTDSQRVRGEQVFVGSNKAMVSTVSLSRRQK